MASSKIEEQQGLETDSDDQLTLNYKLFLAINKKYKGESNKVENRKLEEVKSCLNKGADINAVDNNNTVLHMAIKNNYFKIIRYLLNSGARTDIENIAGKNALALAQTLKCNQEILDLLEKHSINSNVEDIGSNEISCSTVKIDNVSQKLVLWDNLKNYSEMLILEINSCDANPTFLQQKEFYDAIHTAGNLFFVDVMLSHMQHIDEDYIKSQLKRLQNQLIIQCGSHFSTKVYCKDCHGNVNVIDLNSSIENYNEDKLTEKLSNEFGINLIVNALNSNHFGIFETEPRSLLRVTFDLEKQFEGLRLIDCAIRYGDVLTVRLLSLSDWNLMKPNDRGSATLNIAAAHGSMEKFAAVLRIKFPVPLHRIKLPTQYCDQKGDLLKTAIKNKNCDAISFLKRCGAKVENVINSEWTNRQYDVVFSLLKEDCVFPTGFDLKMIDKNDVSFSELRKFVEDRDRLHRLIKKGKLDKVKEFVISTTHSKLYLNSRNQSALYKALLYNKIKTYWWLTTKLKAEFKSEGERLSLPKDVLNSASNALLQHFVSVEKAHIHYLLSKSRCLQKKPDFKNCIKAIYTELDRIPQISTVFKIVHCHEQVDIIYDFDKDSIKAVDLECSEDDRGSCKFKDGRIYIGAKVEREELMGTIVHELTHLAMETVFNNNCNPYTHGDAVNYTKFNGIVQELQEIIQRPEPVDDIISRVFDYEEHSWPAELIVRVDQMLAKYGSVEGLRRLTEQANSLREFYTTHVEPKFESFMAESHLIKDRNRIKFLNEWLGVVGRLKKTTIQFNDTEVVKEFLKNNDKCVLMLSSTSTWLSLINVYQNLENLSEYLENKFGEGSFLIFQFDQYASRKEEINKAVLTEAGKLLVLECATELKDQQFKDALSDLGQLQWKALNKKIILIVESNKLKVLQGHLKSKSPDLKVEIECDVEFTLNNLTPGSIRDLLMDNVLLQNREVPLGHLLDKNSYHLVDAKILTKLINGEIITIGKQPIDSKDYDEVYYVARTFFGPINIKKDIFDDSDGNHMFAIYGSSELVNEVEHSSEGSHAKCIILDSDRVNEQFHSVCDRFPTRNIHLLKRDESGLFWRQTRTGKGQPKCKGDSFRILEKHVDLSLTRVLNENDFVNEIDNFKVVLVSETAGMGKSTVLTQIIKLLNKKHPHLWVIRVNLNDCTKILDEEQKNQSPEKDHLYEALWFLVDSLLESSVESKLETEFDKKLLLNLIQNNEDRVVIMFDGFDEIKETHQNVIKNVLVALKSNKLKQLWVTTRPQMGEETLEDTLNQIAYELQRFNERDQVNFLVNYWRHRLKLGVKTDAAFRKLQSYAEKLIELHSNSISDKQKAFTGVPLQLRMLAECSEEYARVFCESHENQPQLPPKRTLNNLYRWFFSRKHNIFQLDKNHIDFSKKNNEAQNTDEFNRFLNNHRIASLFTVFDEGELKLLLTTDELNSGVSFINDISNKSIDTGLIDLIIEGKPRFVHSTFREYLIAEFIVNFLAEKKPGIEVLKLILINVFAIVNLSVTRAFIDGHLGQKTMSEAILKNTQSKVIPHEMFVDNVSEGKEFSLHLAAKDGHANIVNFLLNCLGDCKIETELMKYVNGRPFRPLHFAAKMGHMDVVKVLVEHKADVNATIVGTEDDKFYGFNALFLAAMYGHADVCEYLLSKGADINATVRSNLGAKGFNVLHIAATRGKLDVVKWLKENTEIDFKAVVQNSTVSVGLNALHCAAYNGQWDVVKWIVSEGLIDINSTYSLSPCDKLTVLLPAIEKSSEMVEWLIKNNADINICVDVNGTTALHVAVVTNSLDVVKLLVNNGANCNAVSQFENTCTPLHCAVYKGFEEIVEFLLAIPKIDVNVINKKGETPFQFASRIGDR